MIHSHEVKLGLRETRIHIIRKKTRGRVRQWQT